MATPAQVDAARGRLELAKRAGMRATVRGEMFDLQLAAYDEPAIRRALHPGRRSGKSEFIPRAAVLDLLKAGFEETVIIGAESQKKAKALHWHKLTRVLGKIGMPFESNKQDGIVRTPWGAQIVFWGIKDEGAVDMLRGFKVRSAYFDEVATYSHLLKQLCDSAVGPALEDTGGPLTLCGTPSVTRAGQWFEICEGDERAQWSVKHWDMRKNPRFPRDALAAMDAAAKRYGGWEDATFQREYLGLFVNDSGMQVYRYSPAVNGLAQLTGYGLEWPHALGVDFGEDDACAWTLLANRPGTEEVYGVLSFKLRGLKPSACADITGALVERTNPDVLVGDGGNLGGNIYIDAINERLGVRQGLQMVSAQKNEKRAYQQLCNGDLRSGTVRFNHGLVPWLHEGAVVLSAKEAEAALKGALDASPSKASPRIEPGLAIAVIRALTTRGASTLTSEMAVLPWANAQRVREHAGYDNHCCDSFLYAWRHFSAYLHGEDPKANSEPAPGTQEYQTWLLEKDTEQHLLQTSRKWWEI